MSARGYPPENYPHGEDVIKWGRWGNVEPIIDAAIEEVNRRIAPAEIVPHHYYKEPDRDRIRFHGRWATFSVDFVMDGLIIRNAATPSQANYLVHFMEDQMRSAIHNAMASIVRNEMTAQVQAAEQRVTTAFLDAIKKMSKEIKERTEASHAKREANRWHRRLWRLLQRPIW